MFLTPLWLRKPRVALVNHPHRALYIGEFGSRAGPAPVRRCSRSCRCGCSTAGCRFSPSPDSARDELVAIDGIPAAEHHASPTAASGPGPFGPGERAPEPRLLYVGRLKAYKRIEVLLDMLDELPEATLDIAGHGDHGETLDDEIARRGLGDRVRVHGYVDEQTKADLYRRAWVHVTASASEGWSLTVMEAALCGTPSAALAVGGLRESIVDGETGLLAARSRRPDAAASGGCSTTTSSARGSARPRCAGPRRSPGSGPPPPRWRSCNGRPPLPRRRAAAAAGRPGRELRRRRRARAARRRLRGRAGRLDGVAGWLTEAQARCLWDAAGDVRGGGRIVEIGSFRGRSTIVLASAADARRRGGGDRPPRRG